jgi:putative ABC transport system substrate-binding protein
MRRREFIALIGGAAAWPHGLRAQQPMPVIGFMSARSPEDSVAVLAAFRRGLGEGSLIEGKNVEIQFRWARGDFNRLPALAAELVNQRVAVLVSVGGEPSALAAKAATSTIPIVFASTDPVKAGLVASLNRPGGNATGVHILTTEVEAKRLSLLRDLVPGAAMFGGLVNPTYQAAVRQAQELAEAARKVGQSLVFANASTDAELDAAFATLTRQRVVAMLVTGDPFLDTARSDCRFRGTTEAAGDLPISRICGGRWPDELRPQLPRSLSPSRHLCREDSQWREAGGPPGDAIGQVRIRDQPQSREDTRSHILWQFALTRG